MDYLTKVPHITDIILDIILGNNLENPADIPTQQHLYTSIYSSYPGLDRLADGMTW